MGKDRTTIGRHQQRLAELAREIKDVHTRAVKALQAGVHHAVEVGRKLRTAHTIHTRLRKKLRRKQQTWPPWKEWVEANCGISVRTAYYWMKLNKARKEGKITDREVNDPDVSITHLMRKLADQLPDDASGDAEDDWPPGRRQAAAAPLSAKDKLDMARSEVRKTFGEIVKEWPRHLVLFVAQLWSDEGGLWDRVRQFEQEATPLAKVWARGGDARGAEAEKEFAERAARAFRDKLDTLTPYQARKVLEWAGKELTLAERCTLCRQANPGDPEYDPDFGLPAEGANPLDGFPEKRRAK